MGVCTAASSSSDSSTAPADGSKRKVVFLGTPDVAAGALNAILEASRAPDSAFEVAAVVTQPGRPKGRGKKKKIMPTPVHQAALDAGIPEECILVPVKANEEDFLDAMRALEPDLMITAAYGNFLPQRFLDIPALGTLNIHPSLLPRWRGAAPVPRSLEAGDERVGVSVAYTVLKMDAGPVLAQEDMPSDPAKQAPEVLSELFERGTNLLISRLDDVWAGHAPQDATAQDEDATTHAPKMSSDESVLDFTQPAPLLHNKVRALAGWPGTRTHVEVSDDDKGPQPMDLKIVRTAVMDPANVPAGSAPGHIQLDKDGMCIVCGDDTALEVLEVQPVGKKAMDVKSFYNGMQGKTLTVVPPEQKEE